MQESCRDYFHLLLVALTQFAVKKVLLRTMKSDSKIFREVNALSRLSHRFIVRYYTTWVETSEPISTTSSDTSDSETGTDDGMTSVPHSREKHSGSNDISFRLDDLDDFGSGSKSSFPSIHFTRSSSPKTDEDDDSEDAFGNLFGPETPRQFEPATPPPRITRTLYIQMVRCLDVKCIKKFVIEFVHQEFVERQTLKEVGPAPFG
jgi:translation initiation factor 2-alpha kinase 4